MFSKHERYFLTFLSIFWFKLTWCLKLNSTWRYELLVQICQICPSCGGWTCVFFWHLGCSWHCCRFSVFLELQDFPKSKNILGMKKDFSLTYRQVKYLRGKYFTMQTESDFRTFRTQSCLQFDNNSGFIADVVTRNSKIIKRSLMFIFHVNTSAISQLYIFKYWHWLVTVW